MPIDDDLTIYHLYAVVGNPVDHSLSPLIHSQFARQTEQNITYTKHLAAINQFNEHLFLLKSKGYQGLNITVPFKQQAFEICDEVSPRAKDAKAVNTLFFLENDTIAGDNTDGVGLVRDLTKNHSVLIKKRKVLVLGAGGAVRGILGPLLVQHPSQLTVANRSLERAETLQHDFKEIGEFDVVEYDELGSETYDLIINGTSAGLNDEIPPISENILGINSVCYDLMYDRTAETAFVKWANEKGAMKAIDGVGMLVEQAAESFYLWRGVMPQTAPVIEKLKSQSFK